MKNRYALSISFLISSALANAQSYCDPSFAFGCFNWRNLAITAGTINWTPGADDCSVSDYTSMSTTVNAGDNLSMSVTNGVWCGCAVWVDFDNSTSFEDSENLHYVYVGADPSYTYDFNVAIPSGTPTGSYRMRVIAPWGSDGFLDTNTNGYGPCGSYQYGNFTDLTLNVVGSNGMQEIGAQSFTMAPNPANGMITLTTGSLIDGITVQDMQGRVVEQRGAQSDRVTIDAHAWSSGVYAVSVLQGGQRTTQRLVVE